MSHSPALGLVAWQNSIAFAAGPGEQVAREAPDPARQTSINHMKQIMLAFHNYNSANGHFPPKAIFGPDGKPKLSWRVALLPFLDEGALFQAFRLDEPWDSPHNKALVARMPEVFTTPSSPTENGTTRIRLFEGPGTLFPGDRGMPIQQMTDGTSNTVAIVAAANAVPWTRPGDLPFAPNEPLPDLDDTDDKGVLVGIADGSVRYVLGADEPFWKMLITPAGGEVVNWSQLLDKTVHPVQPPTNLHMLPTPTATPPMQTTRPPVSASPISPDLDARLRAIEAKLERVLQKLDRSGP